jgi:CcmD family protein
MSVPRFDDVLSRSGKLLVLLFLILVGVGIVFFIVKATTTGIPTNRYLYAAYAVTWVIHGAYLGSLVSRNSHLQREIEELKKEDLKKEDLKQTDV